MSGTDPSCDQGAYRVANLSKPVQTDGFMLSCMHVRAPSKPDYTLFPPADLNDWVFWNMSFGLNRTLQETLATIPFVMESALEIIGHNETPAEMFDIRDNAIHRFWHAQPSDIFYIPYKLRTEFISLSMLFARETLHTELSVGTIMGLLVGENPGSDKFVQLHGMWIWDADRDNSTMWGLTTEGIANGIYWIHAVKPSKWGGLIKSWWSNLTCSP